VLGLHDQNAGAHNSNKPSAAAACKISDCNLEDFKCPKRIKVAARKPNLRAIEAFVVSQFLSGDWRRYDKVIPKTAELLASVYLTDVS
jgi:hypothetical protein